ncbi:MAG: tRNA epoxyqueuosine(34) reductase QueG [Elusimicrobiota bacterium]
MPLDAPTICQNALDSGFDLAAVADAQLDREDSSFWERWITDGNHGEMRYLENPQRGSLERWWPQAASVLMVCLYYQPADNERSSTSQTGRLASYALYADYHIRMKTMLTGLLSNLQAFEPGLQGKVFVDTAPVLERSYAAQAGLGWIGKNSMFINTERGSYCFLGGITFDRHFPVATLIRTDHCGSCRRCIDACPTNALTPYQLDARRCISYLTIEKKTPTEDPDLTTKMGDWLFGCDICQEVCPHNQKVNKANNADKAVKEDRRNSVLKQKIRSHLDISQTSSWGNKEFKAYFAETPVLRAKWPVFQARLKAIAKSPRLIE